MKRIQLLITLVLLGVALTSFSLTGKERIHDKDAGNHVLVSMWKSYDEAAEAGLPQKMFEISADIREKAFARHLPWDYYDATIKYVDAGSARNWKIRDSLKQVAMKGFKDFGDPLLILLYDIKTWTSTPDSLYRFIDAHSTQLKKMESRCVYSECNPFIHTVLLTSILKPCSESVLREVGNDYEFALWSLLLRGYDRGKVSARVIADLKSSFGNSYPSAHFLELFETDMVKDETKRQQMLEDFARKHSGKAVSMIAWQDVLQYRFEEMEGRASSDDYIAFKEVLNGFQKRRSAFRGKEFVMTRSCVKVESMLKELDKKALKAGIVNGKAEFCLRNIDRLRVKIVQGEKEVHEQWLYNERRSFYAYDTLRMEMPMVDDGSYTVVCSDGKEEVGRFPYERYTLSVAYKGSPYKTVYVADYLTGDPLDTVDMELATSTGRSLLKVENVPLEGFSSIPSEIYQALEQTGYDDCRLVISHRDEDGVVRKGRTIYMPKKEQTDKKENKFRAKIMTDRGAYNPGDSLEYKIVGYMSGVQMKAADEGFAVTVELRDSRGEILAQQTHVLNAFGSAAGRFALDNIERNGSHSLTVRYDGMTRGETWFVVDDFILPSFDLHFDKLEEMYLVGDSVTVSGVLKSCSGHVLSSADVKYTLGINRETYEAGQLYVGPDGRFEIPFVASCSEDGDFCNAQIDVKVTDATGETLEFFWSESFRSSFKLSAQILDRDEGEYSWSADSERYNIYDKNIVGDGNVRIFCAMGRNNASSVYGHLMDYRLIMDGRDVVEGSVMSGDTLDVDFSGMASGRYEFVLEASCNDGYGKPVRERWSSEILKVGDNDAQLPEGVDMFVRVLDDEKIRFQIGSAVKPLWAVVELVDDDGNVLMDKGEEQTEILLELNGEASTLSTMDFTYHDWYPDNITVMVTGFRDARDIRWKHSWKRPAVETPFELSVARMEDMAFPDSYCSIDVKMPSDAELLAAVFDKSSEKISENRWYRIWPPVKLTPNVNTASGCNGGTMMRMYKSASQNGAPDYVRVEEELEDVETDAGVRQENRREVMNFAESAAPIDVRDDFSTTLAFEPFIYPSDSGEARLNFRTSDKLSSFVVQMFAHDKKMNSDVVRRDIVVTLPVKVSVVAPAYLYKGDRYVLHASVASTSAYPVSGVLSVEVYNGSSYKDEVPVQIVSEEIRIPAGGSAEAAFDINVPDNLEMKVVFTGYCESLSSTLQVSDGVFVAVPVKDDTQILLESHSSVLLQGESAEDVLQNLRDSFVNVSSAGAEYSETTLIDLLRESLPSVIRPDNPDLISIADAAYANLLVYGVKKKVGEYEMENLKPYVDEAVQQLSLLQKYANEDGGFCWIRGMKSSPIMTAAVLERFAGLRDRGLLDDISELYGEDALDELDETVVDAVKYLDGAVFSVNAGKKRMHGIMSPLQYLYVRTLFAAVPYVGKYNREIASLAEAENKSLLDKVRMVRVLMALTSSDAGRALADSWGFGRPSRMEKHIQDEVESLMEYAVAHPSGGYSYPSAVPSVRGLLESEAYAHSMICDLLSSDGISSVLRNRVADGLRVWIMIQKETQEWCSDPGYLAAMSSVYDGLDAVQDTKVIVLRKRYARSFDEIKASGNGMKVDVKYYKTDINGGRREVECGEILSVGDKLVAVYSLWSQENRSFVRFSAPRPAAFRPVDQISGMTGGWFRDGRTPYLYKEVKQDKTVYWIDVFPEEKTVFEEELFVTQEGEFMTPAAEVECMYSSHYRANSDGGRKFSVNF